MRLTQTGMNVMKFGVKKLQLPADGEEQKLHLVNLVGVLVFVRNLGDFLAEGAHAFHDLFVASLRNAER